jgi:hypothetical protein
MEFISDRVSVERTPTSMSVVISTRLPAAQRNLLIAWLLAWTACGIYFMVEAAKPQPRDMLLTLWIMLAFWAYFELRILRVVLWRMKGFEDWRVKEGELTVKNDLFGYGKATRYFIANIQRFGKLDMEETSWKWQMSDSFWTRGAERLGFEYLGKKVAFGRGITADEAHRLAVLMAQELKRERKASS